MIGLGALQKLWPNLGKTETNFATFLIGMACFQGAALVWIHFFLRNHWVGWREAFGFSEGSGKRALAQGALAILVVLPVAFLLGHVSEMALTRLGMKPELQLAVKMLQRSPPLGQLLFYGAGAMLLAPVAEEMLFRGILYPTLKQSGHRQLAMWVTSMLFASTHTNLMAFVPLTFLALVLTWLYERTGNLLAPIATHVLFNTVNFALLVIQPSWVKAG
ncbi:MAG: CPBP family intramembrane metalloprotease, partial [Verrucomicrobia bacterium]|nr:CPBP family intramembrane metalloprotease [Verrucomicrobiota bacterium]